MGQLPVTRAHGSSVRRGGARLARRAALQVLLIALTFAMAFPFLWMLSSALKTNEAVRAFPPRLLPETWEWGNFLAAYHGAPFGRYIANSLGTALGIVAIQLINTALIAYALTQLRFRGKNALFALIMATNMLPAAATYVPGYIILAKMQLLNTYTGLIISNCVYMFGIFLIRQAFLQVNRSLVEAAWSEGAGHWHTLWHVLFPIAKPSFVTMGLLSFVANYNNYMWPSLITTRPEKYLISQGLRLYFIEGGAYGIRWAYVMAASAFTVLPLMLLFFLTQKWFIQGISDTGVKG
ncbi:MAG: carbohydrate ABC transporter permease [Eubacteriales bacterium]|nr:carbohydrate ABC transporter permease [Christensenellaceae bacterium]MEA5067324.1 carbohydrate ABC transporter permease [Eubacteriales bacterium]